MKLFSCELLNEKKLLPTAYMTYGGESAKFKLCASNEVQW